jgi:hypothetical protein
MSPVARKPGSTLTINFISWRAKQDYSGTEYHRALLLDGQRRYAQLHLKRLVQTLSIVQDQKYFRWYLGTIVPADKVEGHLEEVLTMLRRFIKYP